MLKKKGCFTCTCAAAIHISSDLCCSALPSTFLLIELPKAAVLGLLCCPELAQLSVVTCAHTSCLIMCGLLKFAACPSVPWSKCPEMTFCSAQGVFCSTPSVFPLVHTDHLISLLEMLHSWSHLRQNILKKISGIPLLPIFKPSVTFLEVPGLQFMGLCKEISFTKKKGKVTFVARERL